MVTLEEIKAIVGEVLQNFDSLKGAGEDTPLLGGMPEFDSMAVVSILTSMEDSYGVIFDDDEVSAENFQSLGTLLAFLNSKLA